MSVAVERASARAPDEEEVALLREVSARNREAFDQLYHAYYFRLSRFLERLVYRPDLVEEIVNDTMLVVWRRAGTFNDTSRVSTWIFGIAYKTALKALNRAGRTEPYDAGEEPSEAEDTPERRCISQERGVAIQTALAALSPEQRAVVELTYYHGYAYPEIAQILGCPVDTVKTRMFHARRKLKPLLATQWSGVD
jgi:RNA polymerase sigma factor (sigma-70 family)